MSNTILTEIDGRVGRITLNRPDRLNALTAEMMTELARACEALTNDTTVRVIVLRGAGRGFCAGQDLSERDPRGRDAPFDLAGIQRQLFHPVVQCLLGTPKPVVASVNGVAAGAGAGLALCADIVLAAQDATFAFSFSKVGLSVDAGLGRALMQRVGQARARAWLMLGETMRGQQAAEAGLIWRAVAPDTLGAETQALCDRLANTPRQALAGIKSAMAATHLPLDDYLEIEADAQGRAGADADYAEGVLAFLEKRKPSYR